RAQDAPTDAIALADANQLQEAHVPSSLAASTQATSRPSRATMGGSARWQRSRASGQRGAKMQPSRTSPGAGMRPGIPGNSPLAVEVKGKEAASRAFVYGWVGAWTTGAAAPCSTTRPA